MKGCEFVLERYEYGWLLRAPAGKTGVPVMCFEKVRPLMSSRAVIDLGIAHHYNALGPSRLVIYAITTPAESVKWRAEIEDSIKDHIPQLRWWLGTDVGMSSAAIFAAFCPIADTALMAHVYSKSATPRDAEDLGRCLRLLEKFPGWEARLGELAEIYPDTAWPRIVPRWAELKAATSKEQLAILNECHKQGETK